MVFLGGWGAPWGADGNAGSVRGENLNLRRPGAAGGYYDCFNRIR